MRVGQVVRIDADVEDWGRVTGRATVDEIMEDKDGNPTGEIMVTSFDLRATIICKESEVKE